MGARVDRDKIEVAEAIETTRANKKESSIGVIIERRIAASVIERRIEAKESAKHLLARMDIASGS